MKTYSILMVLISNVLFSQCNPLEVSVYMSEQDGWMFPYSAFYWGMSDGVNEISAVNPECLELLENNAECISDCLYLEEGEVDQYLGRVGCIYYTCADGESLVQNYDELWDRPIHLYGQAYCANGTEWNEELDLCESTDCNGDLNGDQTKDILDIMIMVGEILNEENSCE